MLPFPFPREARHAWWFGAPAGVGDAGRRARAHGPRGFGDDTQVGENRVVVRHDIVVRPGGLTRIVYAAEVSGPDEQDIGEIVTSDVAAVPAALKARVEARRG